MFPAHAGVILGEIEMNEDGEYEACAKNSCGIHTLTDNYGYIILND